MIQNEFLDLVFEFAKESSKSQVAQVILFGSVAKGTADRRSDVDFLVVFDTDKDQEKLSDKKTISRLALDLEKKYDKNIQLVLTNRRFDALDSYFVRKCLKEGIVVYASRPILKIKEEMLGPYTIFSYGLANLSLSEKMRFRRALFGHRTEKKQKGKTYTSESAGLIHELDGRHLGSGAVMVPQQKSDILKETLKRFGVEYTSTDAWLSRD
ncbi:MAG: nucleotidyltransferase domain-containing protein [Candidatus Micrarchaeota archaeon]